MFNDIFLIACGAIIACVCAVLAFNPVSMWLQRRTKRTSDQLRSAVDAAVSLRLERYQPSLKRLTEIGDLKENETIYQRFVDATKITDGAGEAYKSLSKTESDNHLAHTQRLTDLTDWVTKLDTNCDSLQKQLNAIGSRLKHYTSANSIDQGQAVSTQAEDSKGGSDSFSDFPNFDINKQPQPLQSEEDDDGSEGAHEYKPKFK